MASNKRNAQSTRIIKTASYSRRPVDFAIAESYLKKIRFSEIHGVECDLSFQSWKNLMNAKRCAYTGVRLTEVRPDMPMRTTDRTIERIDNSKGYVKGNVCAVCCWANQLKSKLEDPNCKIKQKHFVRLVGKLQKEQGRIS